MTRFILLLIISLFCFTTVQSQSQHMLFKNIPIDEALDSFVKKMEKEGFTTTYSYPDGTAVVMKGLFIGQICEIYIMATNKTKTVWKVSVDLPKKKEWYFLKSDYLKYQKIYIEKYGNPLKNYSLFIDPYYEGDGYELQALKSKNCFFYSYFKLSKGYIAISIGSEGNITFEYEDIINLERKHQEKNNIIYDDI